MQPDMMKMAQQSQSKEEMQPSPVSEGNPEDLKKLEPSISKETYDELGMPSGEDDASMKQRLLMVFEQLGLLQGLTQEGLFELQQQLDDYIKVLKTKDMNKIKNHRITKILDKAAKEVQAKAQEQGMQQPPTQPQQPMGAAPTNFAGMVKPPGGGMSGR